MRAIVLMSCVLVALSADTLAQPSPTDPTPEPSAGSTPAGDQAGPQAASTPVVPAAPTPESAFWEKQRTNDEMIEFFRQRYELSPAQVGMISTTLVTMNEQRNTFMATAAAQEEALNARREALRARPDATEQEWEALEAEFEALMRQNVATPSAIIRRVEEVLPEDRVRRARELRRERWARARQAIEARLAAEEAERQRQVDVDQRMRAHGLSVPPEPAISGPAPTPIPPISGPAPTPIPPISGPAPTPEPIVSDSGPTPIPPGGRPAPTPIPVAPEQPEQFSRPTRQWDPWEQLALRFAEESQFSDEQTQAALSIAGEMIQRRSQWRETHPVSPSASEETRRRQQAERDAGEQRILDEMRLRLQRLAR